MVSLASFSIGMFVTSQFVTREHIKRYVFLGMSLFTSGLLLSVWMPNVFMFILSYGVMMGLGVGAIYGKALMIVSLQDLKRKGLLSGLMLFFFGASSALLAPFAFTYIEANGIKSLFFMYFIFSSVLFLALGIFIKLMPSYTGQTNKGVVKTWGKMFTLMTLMTLIALTIHKEKLDEKNT